MTTIVTRVGKGSPLTNTELDANFTNLNNAKYESGDSPTFATVNGITIGNGAGGLSTNTAIGYRSIYTGTVSGTQNVGVGYFALRDVTSGQYNTAVGAYAAFVNTSGSNNVALGNGALAGNLSGSDNVALGYQALISNTTAGYSIAIGTGALFSSNRTADVNAANTAVGYYAGYNTSTGNYNVFLGNRAGQSNTVGVQNVAVGYSALFGNLSGSYSTAIGYQSAYYHASTGPITAVGFQAGYNYNSVNGSTTFIGYAAGYGGGSGYNTAVGTSALYNGGSQFNTAVGVSAGYTNSAGTHNTYMGHNAGYAHTGYYTTLIGSNAGQALIGTVANTAVGYAALYASTTGDYNTAIGRSAMYTSTGSYSTAVGYQALQAASGSYNVGIGGSAMQNNTSGNYNVAIGVNAGQTGVANSSTIVGYQAGYSINGTGPLTAIGFEAGYSYTGSGTGGTTFVGWSAGRGGGLQSNTAVGTAALYSINSSTQSSTALGQSAGYNAYGDYNTFVGQQAGEQVTSGYANTILGRFNGNSYGVNISTLNNFIVLSDGTGRPHMYFQPTGSGIWRIGYTGQPEASQPYLYFLDSTGYDPGSGRNGLILSNGYNSAQVKAYTTGGAWDVLAIYYGGNAVSKVGLDSGQNGYFQTTTAGQTTGAVYKYQGVAFPSQASSGASSNANTLDAYEEGTWTPVFASTSSNPTVSYTNQVGTYTRIGNQVTCYFDVTASSISGGSGSPLLTGLPFVCSYSQAGYCVIQTRDSGAFVAGAAETQIKGYMEKGNTYAVPQLDNSGTSGYGTQGNPTWAGSGRWTGYITYTTNF